MNGNSLIDDYPGGGNPEYFESSSGDGAKHQRVRLAQNIKKRLTFIRSLKPGWDGYHASSIEDGIVKKTSALLLNALKEVDQRIIDYSNITPCPDGTILLEWAINDGEVLLYVGSGEKLECIVRFAGLEHDLEEELSVQDLFFSKSFPGDRNLHDIFVESIL